MQIRRLFEERPAWVISCEHFSITLGTSETSDTYTLTKPVDPLTSFIVWGNEIVAAGNTQNNAARVTITNSTTVTATRNTASSSATTVYGTVVYCSRRFVKSVQQGTISMSSASVTATITAVRTDKSICLFQGFTTNNANGNMTTGWQSVELTNSTTVTGRINTAGTTCVVGYVVVEFQPEAVDYVEQCLITVTSGTGTTKTLARNVDMYRTALFWGGMTCGNNTRANQLSYAELTDAKTVTVANNTSSASTRYIVVTVIEFARGVVRGVRRTKITLAAATSNTASIAYVERNKSIASFLGYACTGTTHPTVIAGWRLTNDTTLTANLNSAGTDTVSGEAIWFN